MQGLLSIHKTRRRDSFGSIRGLMDGTDRSPDQPGIEPRLLTLEDVATYLSVSVAQVYALVRSGTLPAVKIGGRGIWRVDRKQLDAYVDRLNEDALARSRATAGRKEGG